MAESIYLQLPRAPGPAHWLLVDALGNRIGLVQQGSLADAATQAHGRRLTAFVPGEQVSLFLADIPSRSLQKVQQAVPFLLEDKLAEDADVLHFAAGLRDTGGHLVAVTDQARMRLWLGEIAQAGLEPVQLMADTAALAIQPDTTVIALDGPYVMTRFPDGSGFTAEREFALGLLKRRLGVADGTATPARVVIHATEADDAQGFIAALESTGAEFSQHALKDGVLPLLAAGLRQQRGVNLLQADFQPRSDFQEHWRVWRVAAVLFATCLLLLLIQQGMGYVRLRREATDLDAQVVQLLGQAMPSSKISPGTEEIRMKQLLSQLQGGSSAGALLPLLDALGGAITANPSIQIIALNYQGGSLQAQLQAGDIGALDALKSAIGNKAGITANLDSVNASGSQVTGRITLSGGGP
ncbi:MAG: type II secretion system protein GspL [Gammaproteobacteria bacterium]|jgi:general secretion pathway protein L|nr:type II secretion system protein GspL [Gammaproteobacteria bacterium]